MQIAPLAELTARIYTEIATFFSECRIMLIKLMKKEKHNGN